MTVHTIPVHTGSPQATVVNVDPDVARRWLEANTHNRNTRQFVVNQYARDMAAGQWRFTGEAIKFAHDGTLLDGQHRLLAVVKSGATVSMLVINNLPLEAQDVMDSGIKRQALDGLKLAGYKNTSILQAAARIALALDANRMSREATKINSFSNVEIHQFVGDNNPAFAEAAQMAAHYKERIDAPPSVLAYCWWSCSALSAEATAAFFESIANAATYGAGDPRSALIRRIQTARRNNERLSQMAYLSLFLRTWNAWRKGQEIGRLQIQNQKGEPIPVPVPR
jgi:hypothetical protein